MPLPAQLPFTLSSPTPPAGKTLLAWAVTGALLPLPSLLLTLAAASTHPSTCRTLCCRKALAGKICTRGYRLPSPSASLLCPAKEGLPTQSAATQFPTCLTLLSLKLGRAYCCRKAPPAKALAGEEPSPSLQHETTVPQILTAHLCGAARGLSWPRLVSNSSHTAFPWQSMHSEPCSHLPIVLQAKPAGQSCGWDPAA